MNSAQKKRRNPTVRRSLEIVATAIGPAVVCPFRKPARIRCSTPGAIDLNSDHPLRQQLISRFNTRR
jgi:hypothetical protein